MSDAATTGICGARSKLTVPRKPESDFICTGEPGHAAERHTACDGKGHVLARWRSQTSPVEVWGPWGKAWV